VGLDDEQAVHKSLYVGNAKVGRHDGQATPIQAAMPIGQQVPGTDGLVVFRGCGGRVFAFVLNARLRIQYGRQFFEVACLRS